MNKENVWILTRGFIEGFSTLCEGEYEILLAHYTGGILLDGSSSVLLWLSLLQLMYVHLCMVYMNIAGYDEIWDYECLYEVGCLMW